MAANTSNQGQETRSGQTQSDVAVRQGGASLQQAQPRRVRPAVDIFENGDEILLFADLPGVEPNTLDIRLENGLLSIEGRRTWTGPEQRTATVAYTRSFQLPGWTDVEKIQANLKNGVLELHLPKPEQVKPRQIKVQAQ